MKTAFVVPVFNAPEYTEKCLNSINSLGGQENFGSIFVVDDGSETETAEKLNRIASANPKIKLFRNPSNIGYTKSINIGLREAVQDHAHICLINSDCEIPNNFLEKMLSPLANNAHIGIVSPLSNAASYQSIPFVHDPNGNSFSKNEDLIDQMTIIEINNLLEELHKIISNSIPYCSLYNGFCSIIRSEVFKDIGFFDEELFPIGYGEETDFALRAEDAGWTTAIQVNTFVAHHKSKSFGDERKRLLSRAGHEKLSERYSFNRLTTAEQSIAQSQQLKWVREQFYERFSKI